MIGEVTLTEELNLRGDFEKCGNATYLTGLSEKLPSATQIVSHAGIVKEYSKRRKVLAFARDLAEKSYNGGFEPGEIEHHLLSLMRDSRLGKVETLDQIDSAVWGDIEDAIAHPGQPWYVIHPAAGTPTELRLLISG